MKKILIFLGIVVLLVITGFFVGRYLVKNKITAILNEQVVQGKLTYQDFQFDFLGGNASIGPFTYQFKKSKISAEKLIIRDFSYTAYLFSKKIKLAKIELDKPVAALKKSGEKKDTLTQQKQQSALTKFKKEVELGVLQVNQGQLVLANDSLQKIKLKDYELTLTNITSDQNVRQKKIPFHYEDFHLSANDFTYELNKLERLKLDSLRLDKHQFSVANLVLKPKYLRKDYIKVIPYEKDLITLSIKNISGSDYDFRFENDQPKFTMAKMIISDADVNIYRDKTVKDDPRKKQLYSGMLRKLSLKMGLDSLLIRNSKISYEERMNARRSPGKIFFEKLNAKFSHVTNIGMDRKDFPKTKSSISCVFMGTSPMHVNWDFQVNKPQDPFMIKGRVSDIPNTSMNSFFTPALNMKAHGSIQKVYFNFHGNATQAYGNMRLTYDDFNIEVLRKNGKEKNKVLSLLANIFVNNHPKSGSKSASVKGVQRNPTKSFWNYFWLCVQAGLKKTLSVL